MIRRLFVLISLITLFSCHSDKENSDYLEFSNFTINGKNITPFDIPADTFNCTENEVCFCSLFINENAYVQAPLKPGTELPIRWKIEGEFYEGSEVTVNFPTAGVKEIVLQVVGQKEIFKYIRVSSNTLVPGTFVSEGDSSYNTAEIKSANGENHGELNKLPSKLISKKEKNGTPQKHTGIQDKDEEIIIGPPPPPRNIGKVETRPGSSSSNSSPNTEIVTKQNNASKRPINVEFTKTRTEGASYAQPCNNAEYESSASLTLSPSKDLELESVSVICNNGGTIQVTLLQNGKVVSNLSNRTANKGKTQIRLSTMDAILEEGSTYQLVIKGGNGVEFANLSPCNVKGGGSILNPRYNKVTIFDIKFNY